MPNVLKEWENVLGSAEPTGYYVYAWACADWGGTYFYVGKGVGDRYKLLNNRNLAFEAILRNWDCFPVILEDGLTEEEARKAEDEWKDHFLFEAGHPIMDGEGRNASIKNRAVAYAKRLRRKIDPAYKEGRKKIERPAEFEAILSAVRAGEMKAKDAWATLGVSRGTWYKWVKEVA